MTADGVGGIWQYSLDLARELGRYDIEVGLATLGPPLKPEQRVEAGKVENLTLREGTYKLEWMEEPWDDVDRAGHWLLELREGFGPDVVHLNGYSHAILPWYAPVLVVAHSCVFSWWKSVKHESPPFPLWQEYYNAVRAGLHAADMVVAPTLAMLRCVTDNYGELRSTRVIANARSEGEPIHAQRDGALLAVGRIWDDAKNLVALEKVAPCIEWPIYVAGERRSPDGKQVDIHNLHHLGVLTADELRAWMERCAIYVLPARYEPFGLSILEAAAAGCALVLGDIPSLRENWEGAALFVPPEDTTALRRTLQALIADPSLRERLSRHARHRSACFTMDRMVHEYLDVYHELIAPRRLGTEVPTPIEELACAS